MYIQSLFCKINKYLLIYIINKYLTNSRNNGNIYQMMTYTLGGENKGNLLKL